MSNNKRNLLVVGALLALAGQEVNAGLMDWMTSRICRKPAPLDETSKPNPADVEKLVTTGECVGCSLVRLNLAEAYREALADGKKLARAHVLDRSDLREATIDGDELGKIFPNSKAGMDGYPSETGLFSTTCSFKGANLGGAKLTSLLLYSSFSKAILDKAVFQNVGMRMADRKTHFCRNFQIPKDDIRYTGFLGKLPGALGDMFRRMKAWERWEEGHYEREFLFPVHRVWTTFQGASIRDTQFNNVDLAGEHFGLDGRMDLDKGGDDCFKDTQFSEKTSFDGACSLDAVSFAGARGMKKENFDQKIEMDRYSRRIIGKYAK